MEVLGGWAVSYERGTPVGFCLVPFGLEYRTLFLGNNFSSLRLLLLLYYSRPRVE